MSSPAIGLNYLDLVDIERFCCQEKRFGVMGVDPTFNLGSFFVTPISYPNLSLICKYKVLLFRQSFYTHPTSLYPFLTFCNTHRP